jgi:hypothetical protein
MVLVSCTMYGSHCKLAHVREEGLVAIMLGSINLRVLRGTKTGPEGFLGSALRTSKRSSWQHTRHTHAHTHGQIGTRPTTMHCWVISSIPSWQLTPSPHNKAPWLQSMLPLTLINGLVLHYFSQLFSSCSFTPYCLGCGLIR